MQYTRPQVWYSSGAIGRSCILQREYHFRATLKGHVVALDPSPKRQRYRHVGDEEAVTRCKPQHLESRVCVRLVLLILLRARAALLDR